MKRNNLALPPIAAGGLLLCLFLFVLAVCHCEALHHWLHTDAAKPRHHCVVTLRGHGHIDIAPACFSVQPTFVVVTLRAWPDLPLPPLPA
ncbi:MAG: hypothetical protein ACREIC_27785, partial [Limisphaerales bacterium]